MPEVAQHVRSHLNDERQFIGIEQLDYEENNRRKVKKNVIDGDPTGIQKQLIGRWRGLCIS